MVGSLFLPIESSRRYRSPRQSLAVSIENRGDASARGHPSEADLAAKLFEAATSGEDTTVKKLLDAGANVNAIDCFGRTSLQMAAESGHEIVVQTLVDARANIDALPTSSSGRSALQAASGSGHKGVVRILLEAGANVDVPPSRSSGRTALQAAAENGHEQVVGMLLKAGANIEVPPSELYGRTALQAAAGAGSEKMVWTLLDAGANINTPPCETSGRTALQAAAEGGHEGVVEMLLKYEPDVNAPPANSDGRTALQAAAEKGHKRMVEILLRAGANIDAPIAEIAGKSALQAAAGAGHEAIVKILLDAEASAESAMSESYGAEALEAATSAGHGQVVKILLEGGVNINARNSLGRTCLFSQNLRGEILQMLLKLGAYIDAQDFDGLTPLHWAAEYGYAEILANLLEAGANTGLEDNRIRRPLHVALERRHEDIVKLLLQKGGNIRDSRVGSWRSILEAGGEDIIMISESVGGGITIDKVDINKVEIGVESQNLPPVKRFYSSFGLKWDDNKVLSLVNPRFYMSKYLAITPEKNKNKEKAEVQWMWALVNPRKYPSRDFGPGVPSIGHIATTAQTQALLICHVCFDFHVHVPSQKTEVDPLVDQASFETEVQKSQISWVMRKTETADRRSKSIFRSIHYRSTMEYGWVPSHGVDFVSMFIRDLENKWREIFKAAEIHIKETRKSLLLEKGETTGLIGTLLRDAQKWSDFRALLKIHVKKANDLVKDYQEKRLLYEEVNESEGPVDGSAETATLIGEPTETPVDETKKGKKKKEGIKKEQKIDDRSEVGKLSAEIERMRRNCKDQIQKLEKKTKEMIELEFSLVSIFEARVSTTTGVSMKRLTWITFVFLPLLFTTSLFGMNIDLLGNNDVGWWWYAIFSAAIFIIVFAGWACTKRFAIRNHIPNTQGTDQPTSSIDGTLNAVAGTAPPLPFIRWRKRKVFLDDEETG